jgi:predicted metal-dependent peptidase
MNKEAHKKMTQAKINLIMNAPFFSSIILKLKLEEKPVSFFTKMGVPPTMATDGKNIVYYPEFVNSLSLNELISIVIHEVYHIILLHPTRRGDRDHIKFNKACDYAINLLVKDAGYNLLKDLLYDEQYRDIAAEHIYTLLPEEKKEDGNEQGNGQRNNEQEDDSGNGSGNNGENDNDKNGNSQNWNVGGVMDTINNDGSQMSQSEKEQFEQEWKVAIDQAIMIAKKEGKLPAGMERLIDELLNPQLDYKEILARFITENAKNDYSWKMPNRRYTSVGLYLPSLDSPKFSEGILSVDTSGSISEKELNILGGEIKGVLDLYDTELTVLYVDADVAGYQEISKDDVPIGLKPVGGGGTRFSPAFKWVEKRDKEPAFLIYFTDGYSNDFPSEEPDYPVLWILTEKNDSFNPPFGEAIYMNYKDNS